MSDTSENRDGNPAPSKEHPGMGQPTPPPQGGTEQYKVGYRDGFKDAGQAKKEDGGDEKKGRWR